MSKLVKNNAGGSFFIASAGNIFKLFSLWFPVVAQMGLIFFFSAQPGDSIIVRQFPLPAGIGHFIGYALLGFLLFRAFSQGSMRWQAGTAGKSLLVSLLYAISDELHQLFVPGRQASLGDIFIDMAGVITALAFIRYWPLLRDCILAAGRLK